jgi:predicted anti-sigma-YlaC factor YlaD
MDNRSNNKKEVIAHGLSCEAVQKLIEKRRTGKFTATERDVVFMHSMKCRECRKFSQQVLNELIEKLPKKDRDDWEATFGAS